MTNLLRYLDRLHALLNPPSPTGAQLDRCRLGLTHLVASTNVIEDRLIDLADNFPPEYSRLTARDVKVLYAYAFGAGAPLDILGTGGAILDRQATGADDATVARLLGYRGPRGPAKAKRHLLAAYRRLGRKTA